MAFQKLTVSLREEGGEARVGRVRDVARIFSERFGCAPDGVARAPGRVNLIGEHVDYEGYAVLPMAIEQDVCVAFAVHHAQEKESNVILHVKMEAADPDAYSSASLDLPLDDVDTKPTLFTGSQRWANYVVCGVLAARDLLGTHVKAGSGRIAVKLLVDGRVPPACGLSSSSALVVASALASSAALDISGAVDAELPTRLEMADACRRAERHVGTIGGGMDQAISCLGERENALHISFTPSLQAHPVKIQGMESKSGEDGYAFVVANSGVVAEKAVDAALRYNKRVVECALAAKLMGKKYGLDGWEKIERLAELQQRIGDARGSSASFEELQHLATQFCPESEYSVEHMESSECFGMDLSALFEGSEMQSSVQRAIDAGPTLPFKLQQRVKHVWGESERVARFVSLCSSLENTNNLGTSEAIFKELGVLMHSSHESCRDLYECSCDELDVLVATALNNGALGARLTGAGWGGCIVVLAPNSRVSAIMQSLRDKLGENRGDQVFKSEPAAGADIFQIMAN